MPSRIRGLRIVACSPYSLARPLLFSSERVLTKVTFSALVPYFVPMQRRAVLFGTARSVYTSTFEILIFFVPESSK